MSILKNHAERELEILTKTFPDSILTPFTNEIIALCEAFGNSGQSGGSAPFTIQAILQTVKELMMFEPLTPLTGEEE